MVFKATVPLLTVVPPVYEFVPDKVNVPVPDLTKPSFAPAPLFCRGPVNVEVLLPTVSVAEVPAAVLSTTPPVPVRLPMASLLPFRSSVPPEFSETVAPS